MPATTKTGVSLWRGLLYGGQAASANSGRVFVLNVYSLLAFCSLAIFGFEHLMLEHQLYLGWLEIAGSLVIVLNMLALRVTRNVSLGQSNLLLTMLAMLLVMLITGGLSGTGIFWFFVFPVSAFFLTGKKAGMRWMIALFAAVFAMIGLSQLGVLDLPYPSIVIRQLLVSVFVVAVGIYAYQQSRETLVRESVASERTSEEEKVKAGMIIEHIDEGVVALNEVGHILLLNETAEDMLGKQRRDLIGKPFWSAVTLLDGNGAPFPDGEDPLLQVLRRPHPITVGATHKRDDGTAMSMAVTVRPLVIRGKLKGAIATFRDITSEQAIDRAKSEFVTLASHQLRTPISAIAWTSELLISGDAGMLTDEQKDYVKQIYSSNSRMAALVDAMLTVSSLELGSLPVQPAPLDIAKFCHQVLEVQLKALSGSKRLHVEEVYDPTLPDVTYDTEICRIMLQNLISNAIKYTPTNGNIAIMIHNSGEPLESSATNNILIEVSDTGAGIPKREQTKIFTKLFRADNIKHKDTDGMGLGLYLVKNVTEYVGGRMWFKSTEGKGSTFSVLLPLAMQAHLPVSSVRVPDMKGHA